MQPESKIPKILLIEDNDIDVELVNRIVKRHSLDISVIRASNGVEALEILQSSDEQALLQPYIMLLDINMPMMDGVELLEHIATHGPEVDVPIYILSTSDSRLDRQRFSDYKIAGYLVKPLTKSLFADIVEQHHVA